MKCLYLLLICLVSATSRSTAQSTMSFTVSQFPLLTADAGKDTVVLKGDKVRLGGAIVASGGSGSYIYSWSPATGLDNPSIARPLATIDTSITYQLTVDDGHSCKKIASLKLTVNSITATPDIFNESGISIFPNPAKGFFYILSDKPLWEKKIAIQLFDISGRSVFSNTINGNRRLNEEIKLSSIPKGMYVLKVSAGKNHFTRKIIFL